MWAKIHNHIITDKEMLLVCRCARDLLALHLDARQQRVQMQVVGIVHPCVWGLLWLLLLR